MKRILSIFIACVLLFACFSVNTFAESAKNLQYEVTADGVNNENELVVQAGSQFTVDLYLNNITDGGTYVITSLQNHIYYDKAFFEFVSAELAAARNYTLDTDSLGGTYVRVTGPRRDENTGSVTFENKQLLVKVTFKAKEGLIDGSASTLENQVRMAADKSSDTVYNNTSTQNMTVYIGEKPSQTYTIIYKDGNSVIETLNIAGQHTIRTQPEGTKQFLHWRDTAGNKWTPGDSYTVEKDMTFTAVWKEKYKLTFETNGGTAIDPVEKWSDADTTIDLSQYKPTKTGATFAGWYKDSGLKQKITSITLTEDTTIYAKWTSNGGGSIRPVTPIASKEHKAYILGYGDGTFKADNHMSRAEAATIFARLIAEEKGEAVSGDATFNDVSSESWYDDYIGYLEKYNIVNGYADGSFRPNNTVTRAEFVVMAVRYYSLFNNVSKGNYTASYPDIQAAHWAYADIAYADNADWINGYADGTFRGNNNITRAEVVTIVNKATNRVPDKEYIDSNISALNKFTDLQKNAHWAYYSIMEAANTHTATTSNGTETWTK